MKGKLATLIFGASAVTAAASVAWAATPAQTITARQSNFKAIARAYKSLRDEIGKPAPSLALVSADAIIVAYRARQIPGLFPGGTGQGTGLPTKALPTVWTRNGDFRASANQLAATADAIRAAAEAGNMNGVKVGIGRLGGSCKSCHDLFKAND